MNKKKLKIAFGFLVTVLLSMECIASGTDSGAIDQVITKLNGTVGFTLVNGAPNSMAAHNCASGWVGFNDSNSPGYKSVLAAILSAKASGQEVQVLTDGCLYNGAWNSLSEIYIK